MRAVVIVAHPNPDSFTHAMSAHACAGLRAGGHQVTLHDLYAEGFRAAMSPGERAAYHGDHPCLDPLVAQHQVDLLAAEVLVFVYPTWWSGMPAIMKGWFERVVLPGTGFVFDRSGRVRPGATGVRHLIGISSYGSRRTYVKVVNDGGRRILTRAMRLSTGLRTRTSWFGFYSCDRSDTRRRQRFLDRIEQRMSHL